MSFYQSSICPESEEDEMNYIKDTIKNLLKAEECAIRSKNLMIESYKSQVSNKSKKTKNFIQQILSSHKKVDEEDEEIPLEEPIVSLKELDDLEKMHQVEDIATITDERIKTFSNFLNINISKESLVFNMKPKPTRNNFLNLGILTIAREPSSICNAKPQPQMYMSPLLLKEINSEPLSFIVEDDLDRIFRLFSH